MHGLRVPWQMQDAVELWARQYGRHGRIAWVPLLHCFAVNLTRSPDDPMMREWQEGKLDQAKPPTESIMLRTTNEAGEWVAYNLDELGPDGLVSLLNEGNLWSGRGEDESLTDGIEKVRSRNAQVHAEQKEALREMSEQRAGDYRRSMFDLPFVPSAGVPAPTPSLSTPTTEV